VGRSGALLSLTALLLAACSEDPLRCGGKLPWATLINIAIFDQDGNPVCGRATVQARQFASSWLTLRVFPGTSAVLLPNGSFAGVAGTECNYYFSTGSTEDAPRPCTDTPLRWRVSAEGCEPAEGSWSWEQNIAHGQSDISFYVPVRLRCGAASPSDDAAASADASDVGRQ
jgi:hypothetical protein